jgi:hypothetical protein
VKALAGFKKQTFVAVATAAFIVVAISAAWSMTSRLDTLSLAQADTQTKNNDEKASPPEDTESKSKTDENQTSSGVKERSLKDFRPSEQIEAEQAVDFPYDI